MTWRGTSAVKAILMKYHLLRNVVGNILKLRAPKIYIFKKKQQQQKKKPRIFLDYLRKWNQTINSTGFDATSLTLPSLWWYLDLICIWLTLWRNFKCNKYFIWQINRMYSFIMATLCQSALQKLKLHLFGHHIINVAVAVALLRPYLYLSHISTNAINILFDKYKA